MSVIPATNQQYPFELYSYFFNPKTPNLATGVPVLVPDPGAVIFDAFIAVPQAWDGTTPKADIGWLSTENNVQIISESGPPTAGNFTVKLGNVTSGNIAWNSTAAAAQTAIQAMSNVGAGNALVTGGPLPGTPLTVTFTGALTNTTVPAMTTNSAGLTGGTASVIPTDSGLFQALSVGAAPINLSAASAGYGPALKASSDESIRLVVPNPKPVGVPLELQLIANQTGAPGGASSGSTVGTAMLYLVMAKPISLNPSDPPLPLD